MEIYEDWLSSEMTRSEFNELSTEDKKERKRLQNIKYHKKHYYANKEKVLEKAKEYNQTPNGKKTQTLSDWKRRGLQESPEDLDRIYELWQTQELCNACDCVLTRDGDNSSTDASMDHDHITNRFRHIICRSCNTNDNWKKYFC